MTVVACGGRLARREWLWAVAWYAAGRHWRLIACGLLFPFVLEFALPMPDVPALFSPWWAWGLVAGVVLINVLLTWWDARRRYRTDPLLTQEAEISFDGSGIATRSDAATGRVAWTQVTSVHETSRMFLLLIAPARLVALPKRFFRDIGDQSAFRDLVRNSIGSRAALRSRANS